MIDPNLIPQTHTPLEIRHRLQTHTMLEETVTGPEMVDKVELLERVLHVVASVVPWLGSQRKRAWV